MYIFLDKKTVDRSNKSTQSKDPLLHLHHQLATNQEARLRRPNGMQGAMLEEGVQFEHGP